MTPPTLAQPMAMAATRELPPESFRPRQELAVPPTTIPLEPLRVVPLQFVALLTQVKPELLVEMPVQLVAFPSQ
jgi:hypothetical protein